MALHMLHMVATYTASGQHLNSASSGSVQLARIANQPDLWFQLTALAAAFIEGSSFDDVYGAQKHMVQRVKLTNNLKRVGLFDVCLGHGQIPKLAW